MLTGVGVGGRWCRFVHVLNPSGAAYTYSEKEISWKSDRDKKFKDPGFQTDGSGANIPWTVAGYSPNVLTRNLTSGVAIGIDKNGQPLPDGENGITNEHFIVWMRTAGLPTFKKLWARFPDGFTAGQSITITIANSKRRRGRRAQPAAIAC